MAEAMPTANCISNLNTDGTLHCLNANLITVKSDSDKPREKLKVIKGKRKGVPGVFE